MNNLLSQSVKVPHRSGHYLGHHFMFTAPVGTLIPALCHPIIPNTKIHLKTLLSAELAPLATSCYLRTSVRLEAFFCPMRFLYGGFEQWLTRDFVWPQNDNTWANRRGVKLPRVYMIGSTFKQASAPGSLLDYLGIRCIGGTGNPNNDEIYDNDKIYFNIFPLACYHYIVDQWYLNSAVQSPNFIRPTKSGSSPNAHHLPYIVYPGSSVSDYGFEDINLSANNWLLQLRQRNFPVDYFTSAMVSPQVGDEQTAKVDTSGGNSYVSISAIRAASSLQIWRERLGLAGRRLVDYVRANYGADLSDGNARRPMYLGSGVIDLYNKGVDQSYNDVNAGVLSTRNPFKTVGAQYGRPAANGEVTLVEDFTAQEPGYLMVMCSVVPKVNYASGVERYMMHYCQDGCETDLANPILQNVGNQPIYSAELTAGDIIEPNGATSGTARPYGNRTHIFAYQQRYSEYMFRNDRISGLFRDDQSLESFVSQRVIAPSGVNADDNTLTSAFLEIPTTYLDQVSAVQSGVSQYGAMIDSYFDFAVSQPLYESSVPSLVNPSEEHGKDVVVMRGGKRIV